MTRNELNLKLLEIVGDLRKVEKIFELFGKLSPECDGNIKPPPPVYNKSQVRRVGRQKIQFTPIQRNRTRELLRKLGMI